MGEEQESGKHRPECFLLCHTVCHILRGSSSEGLWGNRSQHYPLDEELFCNLFWCLFSLLPPFCTILMWPLRGFQTPVQWPCYSVCHEHRWSYFKCWAQSQHWTDNWLIFIYLIVTSLQCGRDNAQSFKLTLIGDPYRSSWSSSLLYLQEGTWLNHIRKVVLNYMQKARDVRLKKANTPGSRIRYKWSSIQP